MKLKLLYSALIAILLTACGGGGGGGSSSSSDSGSGGGGGGGGGGSDNTSSAPTFSTGTTASVLEGTRTVLTVEASAGIEFNTEEGSGPDNSKFTLSTDNELIFNTTTGFDFEAPIDSDTNNVYQVSFVATEGSESTTLDLAITVTDAFEGRVIDGPVSGATVFIDADGDYTQDADELSGTTDINGLFFVEKGDVTISASSKLISVGGTDTTTNKALPDLALVSDVPTAASASAYITPLSTIIAAADTPAAKKQVLTSLGISATALGVSDADTEEATAALVQAFLAKDVWAESVAGDAVAQAIQTKNVQIAEVLISAVNVADTSDAATAVSRAVAMTRSFAEGLVTQAATGQQIISTETAADGTVSFKLVEDVISSALVVAVQTYTALATITDTSLDQLVATATALEALAVFAADLAAVITSVTDQLNFADITDVSAVSVITAAKDSAETAVTGITTAVVAADATELAAYASGSLSSTIAATVTSAEASVVEGVAAAVAKAATASAQAAADLTNTGYSLPEVISVLETVE